MASSRSAVGPGRYRTVQAEPSGPAALNLEASSTRKGVRRGSASHARRSALSSVASTTREKSLSGTITLVALSASSMPMVDRAARTRASSTSGATATARVVALEARREAAPPATPPEQATIPRHSAQIRMEATKGARRRAYRLTRYKVLTAKAMKKPIRLPATTCGEVCPLISLTGLNGICKRFESLEPSELSVLACTPAARLTPIASRMTTRAKKKDNANTSESMPLENAIEVDMAMTSALWLEGIPPVFQRSVENISWIPALRFVKTTTRALANCAMKRLSAADRNTLFLSMALINSTRWCSIARISSIIASLVKPIRAISRESLKTTHGVQHQTL